MDTKYTLLIICCSGDRIRLFATHYLFVEIVTSFCLATLSEQRKSWKIQLHLQASKIDERANERASEGGRDNRESEKRRQIYYNAVAIINGKWFNIFSAATQSVARKKNIVETIRVNGKIPLASFVLYAKPHLLYFFRQVITLIYYYIFFFAGAFAVTAYIQPDRMSAPCVIVLAMSFLFCRLFGNCLNLLPSRFMRENAFILTTNRQPIHIRTKSPAFNNCYQWPTPCHNRHSLNP